MAPSSYIRLDDPEPPTTESSPPAEGLKGPFSENKISWLFAGLSGVWLTFAIAYISIISSSPNRDLRWFAPTVANTTDLTRYLRYLSESVALILPALLASSSNMLRWAATSSKRGLSFSTWLSMSSTSNWGLWKLFWWKTDKQVARDFH